MKGSNEHKRHYAQILSSAALIAEEWIDFHGALIEKHFREVLTQMSDALREQFSLGFLSRELRGILMEHMIKV